MTKNLQIQKTDKDEPSPIDAILRQVLGNQPMLHPRAEVWGNIQIRTLAQNARDLAAPTLRYSWLLGVAVTMIVLVFLWATVQPGVVLEWTVEGQLTQSFKVYRAQLGSEDYQVIREIAASPGIQTYQFVDGWMLPGTAYAYRVEGIGQEGPLAFSKTVSAPPLAALPGQLAITFTSLVLGFSVIILSNNWRGPNWRINVPVC